MAMADYRVPEGKEIEILRRNGIDPESVAVTHRDERSITLLCYKTRDQISIRQGDKKW